MSDYIRDLIKLLEKKANEEEKKVGANQIEQKQNSQVGTKKPEETKTESLHQKTNKEEEHNKIVGDKKVCTKQDVEKGDRKLAPTVLSQLDKKIWILGVSENINRVRKNGKTYSYLRKRIELPKSFSDDVAVVMTRKGFVELMGLIAEALGYDPEAVKKRVMDDLYEKSEINKMKR